ncbi:butyrophilin subfamily 1 member A1-like isoform X2 [Saccopteryx leptura]|uniref:butyrophilin subfamily 1 member A1-like isoform X2 n=1 Tax=Saccopteryx leptura TaxID=249018 RepID=UPI00339C9758
MTLRNGYISVDGSARKEVKANTVLNYMRVNKKCYILHRTTNLQKIMIAALLVVGALLVYQVTSENPRENEKCAKDHIIITVLGIIIGILILIISLFYIRCIKICKDKEELKKILAKSECKNDELQQIMDRRKSQFKSVWRKAPLYPDWRKEEFRAVTVTLDAATAHPALHLSENGRQVTWQERGQDLPRCTQRFKSLPCVLGQLHITSGRCYWEVEVENSHSWDLGVCGDNVTRKGRVTMSPQNGFWAIRLYSGEYWALTSPETLLSVRESPLKVGIFLDYEDGDVSFFNMTDGSHIFRFSKNTFHGVLRPLFRLWSSDSGFLSICPGEGKEVTDVAIPMLH